MKFLIVMMCVLIFILIILTILNSKRLKELSKKESRFISEYKKVNRRLMNKIVEINLITFLSSCSAERKIKEIEKVIHSSDQTDIDNF